MAVAIRAGWRIDAVKMAMAVSARQETREISPPSDDRHRSAPERTFGVRIRSFGRAWGSAMLLAGLGLVVWEILVRALDVQTWILPPVSLILAELVDKPSLFLRHASVTAQEITDRIRSFDNIRVRNGDGNVLVEVA